jgi:tetratricopeptide (TPR) repeat protein
MMYRDCRGLEVSASSHDSIDGLDRGIGAYLGSRRDTVELVDAARAADPECTLAHCLKGYLLMHAGKPDEAALARDIAVQAGQVAEGGGATAREKLHIAALKAWNEGQIAAALERWEAILCEHPLDILALRLAQFMTSYLGDSRGIRDSVARVFPAWDQSIPGYGFMLGCYAYGLEEAGDYAAAERHGRSAVNYNRSDIWAAHAVVHVMEMQGRPRDGISWMTASAGGWRECGNFVFHLAWHRCLFHLALEEFDTVLDLYDAELRPVSTDEYLDIANASSMLWRLEQSGVDVRSRWEELADRAASHIDDHLFVLADLHYALALAAKAPASVVNGFLESCSRFAKLENRTQSGVMQQVGMALVRSIVAHRRGDYAEAAALLCPVRELMPRIGGSHAQRDVFEHLVIDSAAKGGRIELALSLLAQRTSNRPGDIWGWRNLASLSESVGSHEDAEIAWAHVRQLC